MTEAEEKFTFFAKLIGSDDCWEQLDNLAEMLIRRQSTMTRYNDPLPYVKRIKDRDVAMLARIVQGIIEKHGDRWGTICKAFEVLKDERPDLLGYYLASEFAAFRFKADIDRTIRTLV